MITSLGRFFIVVTLVAGALSCQHAAPRSAANPDRETVEPDEHPRSQSLPTASADEVGLNPDEVEALLEGQKESLTDAFVLVVDGHVVGQFQRPEDLGAIETMSVSKSVLALVVGLLLDDRLIKSLHQPVAEFFPEWADGPHAEITVGHLMTQTSGLADQPNTRDIYASDDFVHFALQSEQANSPGTTFFYSNSGTNLLAGVANKATGDEGLLAYAERRLFAPLGITDWSWDTDPAGNPQGMAGISLTAEAMAKLGLLVLNECKWDGAALLSTDFCGRLTSPFIYDSYGLLWWLDPAWTTRELTGEVVTQWREAEVDPEFIKAVVPLAGEPMPEDEFWTRAGESLGEDPIAAFRKHVWSKDLAGPAKETGPLKTIRADGYLGQFILIYPDADLVAVRQVRWREDIDPEQAKEEAEAFRDAVDELAASRTLQP